MRLGPEQQAIVRQIEDEAVASCRLPGGRVDHVAAALYRRDALAELEAAGHVWAATLRDSAELHGHRNAIARRVKATAFTVPMPTGSVTLPAAYSRRQKDGSRQMSFWMYFDLDQLEGLIREMQNTAGTYGERALAMQYGLDLARKHGVPSAAEGFEAEGIRIPGIVVSLN